MIEEPTPSASAPSINKVPFLVFDGILVLVAVALAFSSDNPLSPFIFFWILFCVAAGGLVACLPFWMEFRDRNRLMEYEIRERQNLSGSAQWQYVDARLSEMGEQLHKDHQRLAESADRLMRLEARPQGPDAAQLTAQVEESLQKRWPSLREELLAALATRNAALLTRYTEEQAAKGSAQAAESSTQTQQTQQRLDALHAELATASASLASLETQVAALAASTLLLQAAQVAAEVAPATLTSAASAAPATESAEALVPSSGGIEALVDEAAFESDPQADLSDHDVFAAELAAKAPVIDAHTDTDAGDESDVATAAVAADIAIDADTDAVADFASEDAAETTFEADVDLPEENPFDDAAPVEAFADELESEAGDSDAFTEDELTDTAAGVAADPDERIADSADSDEQTAAPADSAAAAGLVVTEPVTEKPVTDEPSAAEPVSAVEPAAALQQPVLLDAPEAPRAVRAKKSAAGDRATLVAQVLIGIGNKPYVRGEGPGLSMDKGVPMQFVEIGKWEWVCPEADEPVLVQIYKNDEVPSALGEILLEPGQRRAVTPTFPK